MPAACLVAVGATDHDRWRIITRWFAADESLITAGRIATTDADRVQLVHDLGYRKQLRHRAKWLAAEIGVGAGEDHPFSARGERRHELHDRRVEELRLVDCDHVRRR